MSFQVKVAKNHQDTNYFLYLCSLKIKDEYGYYETSAAV